MKQGDMFCFKITGELVIVLEVGQDADDIGPLVNVRTATDSANNGVMHKTMKVYEFELETPMEHLERKAETYAMQLKVQKSAIGKEIKKLEAEAEEREPFDISKFSVN